MAELLQTLLNTHLQRNATIAEVAQGQHMKRWAPIDIRLLQTLKPGVLHSKVDAALTLSIDRMNGIERSAREYARQWAWSTDKAIRFMQDPKSYINLSRDSVATPEDSASRDLQAGARQQRDKTLAKVSATVERQQHDSDATPETSINDDPHTGTRHKYDIKATVARRLFIKEEEKKNNPCPSPSPTDLYNLWNQTAEGTPLPAVREFNSNRQKKCAARLKERSLEEWGAIFSRMVDSPFLCGQSDRGWKADFDWIIDNDGNASKVLEGKYDRSGGGSKPSDNRYAEIFAGA